MALGIVDGVLFQISRILESVFDGIEYGLAKNARNRMAKQKKGPSVIGATLSSDPYKFQDGPRQRQRMGQEY